MSDSEDSFESEDSISLRKRLAKERNKLTTRIINLTLKEAQNYDNEQEISETRRRNRERCRKEEEEKNDICLNVDGKIFNLQEQINNLQEQINELKKQKS